jgi:hypothetical protein
VYLDDLHVLAKSYERCSEGIKFVRDTMKKAGIVEAKHKFQPPTQRGKFLGLINNLAVLKYEIPEDKLASILTFIDELLQPEVVFVPTRRVASLYGKISACRLATGPIMRLLTRTGQAYYSADGREDWDGNTDVRPFKAELQRLKELLPSLSSYNMFGREETVAIDTVVASDASGVGFGLVKVNCGGFKEHVSHEGPCSHFLSKRFFTKEERVSSSGMREILALRGAYEKGDLDGMVGKSILHLTDSAVVEAVMRIGSPVPELQREAIAIFNACKEKGIHLRVEWRPRKDMRMVEADLASRMFDVDDFGCSEKDFDIIKSWAGFPLKFDLFASHSNAKCENFAVRFAEISRRDFVNVRFRSELGGFG